MALNQQKTAMLAQIMAVLQGAAPAGPIESLPGGIPPPRPPPHPPVHPPQASVADSGFLSKAFWEAGSRDMIAIVQEIGNYNQFLATNPEEATALSVVSGWASLSVSLSTKMNERRPLLVHSLGTYGYMVMCSHFRGQLCELMVGAYLTLLLQQCGNETHSSWSETGPYPSRSPTKYNNYTPPTR
jgi:hypothetical protein